MDFVNNQANAWLREIYHSTIGLCQKRRNMFSSVVLQVCFFRQFLGSVTKVDYLALRHGFIVVSKSDPLK